MPICTPLPFDLYLKSLPFHSILGETISEWPNGPGGGERRTYVLVLGLITDISRAQTQPMIEYGRKLKSVQGGPSGPGQPFVDIEIRVALWF